MSDLNKWVGSGRLTRDVELRYVPSGSAVCDLSLASNQGWNKDGEKQEKTTFVDITLWGKQAEVLEPYLKKGTYVLVEGRLELDQWKTDEGVNRSKLKVVAERVNLGPRSASAASGDSDQQVEEVEPEEVPF